MTGNEICTGNNKRDSNETRVVDLAYFDSYYCSTTRQHTESIGRYYASTDLFSCVEEGSKEGTLPNFTTLTVYYKTGFDGNINQI